MLKDTEIYDCIIVGAGPAGSSAALYARRRGLKTLLLEKAVFPRDKVCGDALSGKSMFVLSDLGLSAEIQKLPYAEIDSITFSNPKHTEVNISLIGSKRKGMPTGMVLPRKIFDHFLFRQAIKNGAKAYENFSVEELILNNGQVIGVRGNNRQEFYGRIIMGADGFNSVVARKTGLYSHDPKHWVVALRRYYKNVKDLNKQIELHFVDEVIPGYFWIFPAGNGLANVGIGMLHEYIKKNKVNLKALLKNALESPVFRERFNKSQALEEPAGWNLPVGSTHRTNYGNGFLLLGDAAGLIDPFSGEGIGNALFSGKIAAEVAAEALRENDFSAGFLRRYDQRLWTEIGPDLANSTKLQHLGSHRFLLNLVINKAARNNEVKEVISGMMADQIPKSRLANPLFYLKLIFS